MARFNPLGSIFRKDSSAIRFVKVMNFAATTPIGFAVKYHGAVMRRLDAIRASTSSENRFLAISISDKRNAYVQVMFTNGDSEALCEAASGFYDHVDRLQITSEGLATLKRHGFSTDASNGNFQREWEIADHDDIHAIAHVMLTILYEVYGARLHSRIEFDAPLAREI